MNDFGDEIEFEIRFVLERVRYECNFNVSDICDWGYKYKFSL